MDEIYSKRARQFFDAYRKHSFESVHRNWIRYLPEPGALALDVGAGSGRDAEALAARGWSVIAVEPAARLRALGRRSTSGHPVQWIDDRLPELNTVRAFTVSFDLILVSAVWMHLLPTQRDHAFRNLSELLTPGGVLVISLRHGPSGDNRIFHETIGNELLALARNHGLETLQVTKENDQQMRIDVWWEVVVCRRRD